MTRSRAQGCDSVQTACACVAKVQLSAQRIPLPIITLIALFVHWLHKPLFNYSKDPHDC